MEEGASDRGSPSSVEIPTRQSPEDPASCQQSSPSGLAGDMGKCFSLGPWEFPWALEGWGRSFGLLITGNSSQILALP